MKKLLFAFIATVAMTFAACGGQTASVQTSTDSDSVVVDSVIADTIEAVVDSVVAE